MNKKGFTLVELLAVFVLMFLISMVTIPSINKVLQNNSEKKYFNYEEILKQNLALYHVDYKDDLFFDNEVIINSDCIEDGKYICSYTKIYISSDIEITESMFKDKNLESVTIAEGVTSIGEGAFQDNLNLKEITIPSTVLEIEKNAFHNTGLKEVNFYSSPIANDDAFDEGIVVKNYSGTNIQVENALINVVKVDDACFTFLGNKITAYKCSFSNIIIPQKINGSYIGVIDEKVFNNKNLSSIYIEESIYEIRENAFNENSNLNVIVNTTGRKFDWANILNGGVSIALESGKVGNVSIVSYNLQSLSKIYEISFADLKKVNNSINIGECVATYLSISKDGKYKACIKCGDSYTSPYDYCPN